MTVPANIDVVLSYPGDGTDNTFPITFPTFEVADVIATIEDVDGNETLLVINDDFTLSSIGIPNTNALLTLVDDGQPWIDGGNLADDYTLIISFNPEAFQPASFSNLGRYQPVMLEKVLDRIVLASRAAVYQSSTGSQAEIAALQASQAAQDVELADHEARITVLEGAIGNTVELMNADFTAEYAHVYIVTGAVNVQLPAPLANSELKIKLSGSGPVTLLRAGSEDIDFVAANRVLSSTKMSVTLVTDGTDWFII